MELTPAFVLHHRPYRESSLLVDVFTPTFGRQRLVARGVKKTKRQSAHAFQLFQPLWISWFGQGELVTLQKVEQDAPAYRLQGEAVLCGLYLNELLFHLLPSHEAEPDIYRYYQQALKQLATEGSSAEVCLRIFEKRLLEQLGYGLHLLADIEDNPIQADAHYHYVLGHGLSQVQRPDDGTIQGRSLIQLEQEIDFDEYGLKQIKQMMRTVLNYYLDGRPLKSRQLFAEMHQFAKHSHT